MFRINKNSFAGLLLIISILSLGAFLRLYKLDQIPNGFYVDEAAMGYNAQSLLTTGKDEYGKAFPIFLRSHGTYPPALYAYMSMIPIKFLGLSVYSTRIVAAISGIILILLIFLILKELNIFKNKFTPYIGTFLFAISPWSIFFSRGILEPNLGFVFLATSFYFFLLARRNLKYFPIAIIFLAFSTYAYPSERLIAYILLLGFICLEAPQKQTKAILNKRIIPASIALFIILQLPQLALSSTPAFTMRASNLFYGEAIESQAAKIEILPGFISLPLAFVKEFSSQFLSYLSPRNLFLEPDSDPQRSLPETSVFYPWMFIPYLVGFAILARRWRENNSKLIILLVFATILPAALTKDPFSSLRALPLVLPTIIIISLGIDNLLKTRYKTIWLTCGVLLIPISLLLLWRSYFVFLPSERANVWGYGFEQLAEEVEKYPDEQFVIEQARTTPIYIQLAFFLKYPPEELQKEVDQNIKNNYYNDTEFDSHYTLRNVEIRGIKWKTDIYQKQILVGDALSISPKQASEHELEETFEIKDPMGEVAFRGFRTNPEKKCAKTQYLDELCKNLN